MTKKKKETTATKIKKSVGTSPPGPKPHNASKKKK